MRTDVRRTAGVASLSAIRPEGDQTWATPQPTAAPSPPATRARSATSPRSTVSPATRCSTSSSSTATTARHSKRRWRSSTPDARIPAAVGCGRGRETRKTSLLGLLQVLPGNDVGKRLRAARRGARAVAGLAQRRKRRDGSSADVGGRADRRLDGDRAGQLVERLDLRTVQKVVENRYVLDGDGDQARIGGELSRRRSGDRCQGSGGEEKFTHKLPPTECAKTGARTHLPFPASTRGRLGRRTNLSH